MSKRFLFLAVGAMLCTAAFAQNQGGATPRPTFDWENYMPGEYDGTPVEVTIPGVDGGPFFWGPDDKGNYGIYPQTFDPGVDAALAVMGELARLDLEFKELRDQYEAAIQQISVVTKDLKDHEKTPVTVVSGTAHSFSGGASDFANLVSGFQVESGVITAYSHALGFTDGLLTISGAGTPFPLPLAKVATSGALSDVSGWPEAKTAIETAYSVADTQVKEDLTNMMLKYHPPEEGVPDEATNILAKVAFDGDYNSLTNTPELVVEEAGGEGENKTYTFRLKARGGGEGEGSGEGGEQPNNSLALAAIALSGAWGDLKGMPDQDVTLVKAVAAGTDGVAVTTARYHMTTNGLEEVAGSASTTGPTKVCDCENGGGGGGGDHSGDGDHDGGGCDCTIKTAADVRAAENDPVFTTWNNGTYATWKAYVDGTLSGLKKTDQALFDLVQILSKDYGKPSIWPW